MLCSFVDPPWKLLQPIDKNMSKSTQARAPWLSLAGILLSLIPGIAFGDDTKQNFSAEELDFFEQEVLPVLQDNCLKCHAGEEPKGELNLTSRKAILSGGESGPAVDLEDLEASYLLEAINYEGWEMPPTGQMSPDKIEVLTKWVDMKMPWPADLHEIEFEAESGPPPVNEETKAFWSFQPVSKPALPEVKNKAWLKNEIDSFILSRLEAAGLEPSAPAEPRQLIRRAHFDLVGLPPPIELVEKYAADPSPQHFESIIDDLLESPHYGEHWARHWLDLVRYAETNSYERDGAKPYVWRYRDYVIKAFNADKPYDQFVMEQLAGDELDHVTAETMIATGYYRLGRWDDEPADPQLAFYDDIDDIVTTTGQTFLGLTINCARCHDHKIDPIPQADYYSMVAFFRNVKRYGVRSAESVTDSSITYIDLPPDDNKYEVELAKYEKQVEGIRKTISKIEGKVRDDLNDVEKEEFQFEMNRLPILAKRKGTLVTEREVKQYEKQAERLRILERNRPKELAQALVVKEDVQKLEPTFVLTRGSPRAPAAEVKPAFPSVLSPPAASVPESLEEGATTSGRRRVLASWIVDPQNPLTSRVMVNRIWQYHFGRGIVQSSSDFGFQGNTPTHPALLDWLASSFVDMGWSMKRMHKKIMMSAAYQQASKPRKNAYAKDPTNELFWRYDMRRLTSEEIRDSLLWATGELNKDKMFGPSIYTDIPDAVKAGQSRPGSGWGKSSIEDENRRSIYIHVKRSLPDPLLEAFDMADMDLTCPVRFVTTQPTQALGMLNSEFIGKRAKALASYLAEHAGDEIESKVELAIQRVTQRNASEDEVARAMELIHSLKSEESLNDEQALEYFCLLVLNLNEFLYLD